MLAGSAQRRTTIPPISRKLSANRVSLLAAAIRSFRQLNDAATTLMSKTQSICSSFFRDDAPSAALFPSQPYRPYRVPKTNTPRLLTSEHVYQIWQRRQRTDVTNVHNQAYSKYTQHSLTFRFRCYIHLQCVRL